MLFVKMGKRFFIITIALAIGISILACGEEVDLNNLPPLRDNIINPGHQTIQTFNDITAVDLVADIKIGWNLGNSFDAHDNQEGWFPSNLSGMETAWGNPVTTRQNIDAIKNAGFNTIRIPVTWYKVLDKNFNIRENWLARVTEVVNWAEANDMYIIINTHHDESIFRFTDREIERALIIFGRVWEQIAFQFQNYNEKLIFEALNEPRTKGVPHEWSGGNAEERNNLNKYYQLFVDIVRESGGNNDKRILMVNTYAASANQNAMDGLVIPKDPQENKIIVSIHAYVPFFYAHEFPGVDDWASGPINDVMTRAYNTFISKGIPVVMGEFAVRRERHDTARAAEWAEFYVSEARKRGIPCIWWDDGGNFRIFDRRANRFEPVSIPIRDALMRGAGVN
jgi:endoglucanase